LVLKSEASDKAPNSYIHGDEHKLPIGLDELEVIYPFDLCSVHVDDLFVQEELLQTDVRRRQDLLRQRDRNGSIRLEDDSRVVDFVDIRPRQARELSRP
jgi:hypothetical protein